MSVELNAMMEALTRLTQAVAELQNSAGPSTGAALGKNVLTNFLTAFVFVFLTSNFSGAQKLTKSGKSGSSVEAARLFRSEP